MNDPSVHFSRKSDEWITPDSLFQQLSETFKFTLDPCATPENAKCAKYYTVADNGLAQDWGTEVVFMNPPYSDVARWVEKAHVSAMGGATVVALVPTRSDTPWWGAHVLNSDEIWFIKGRVRFDAPDGGKSSSAPFPSVVVIFRPEETFVPPTVSTFVQRRVPRVRGGVGGAVRADPPEDTCVQG